MRRRLLGAVLLSLLVWPVAAWAAPDVGDLVTGAIQALKSKSYDARLRFISYSDGSEQTVHIYHVAPELYRVVPLVNGKPGSTVYIENSVQLVMASGKELLQLLPDRQFYPTDMLTVKFLRDLGTHPGTSVLDGQFNGAPVYFLRQDVTRDKPYLITVGLRKDNKFPAFLQVVDAQGRIRAHYEFESIKFVAPDGLSDDLFEIPEPRQVHRMPSSHLMPLAAPAPSTLNGVQTAPESTKPAELPLFPEWLPDGYRLEAISVLDYRPAGENPSVVYHFEIYGPQLDNMLSVFQMPVDKLGNSDLSKALGPADGGYLLQKKGHWVVAVFGDVAPDAMQRVIDSLDGGREDKVKRLLAQTRQRDQMMEQAVEAR